MPVAITYAQPTNYAGDIVPLPLPGAADPPEGRVGWPLSIKWGSANDGGANDVVTLDLNRSATFQTSRVAGVYVDNSGCSGIVQIISPQAQDIATVPPFSIGFYPLFARGKTFIAVANGAAAGDISRFKFVNFWVPPFVAPLIQYPSVNVSAITAAGTGAGLQTQTVALVASGNGVLRNMQLLLTGLIGAAAAAAYGSISVKTHAPVVTLWQSAWAVNAAKSLDTTPPVLDWTDVSVPFVGGLDLVFVVDAGSQLAAGGKFSANFLYTPH